MFENMPDAKKKAARIVRKLSSYSKKQQHETHLHYDDCDAMGLNIEMLEDDPTLQDHVLTVHHCFMHTLMNSAAYKIIENHLGVALVKNIAQQIAIATPP